MLLAGLTLLPALLAILGRARVLAVQGRARAQQREGALGPDRGPPRAPPGAHAGRRRGRSSWRWPLAALGYRSGGFGGAIDRARRVATPPPATPLLAAHFPQSSANPANLVLPLSRAGVARPRRGSSPPSRAAAPPASSASWPGRSNPNGTALTPAQYAQLHAQLGTAAAPARSPSPPGSACSAAAYNAYRATAGVRQRRRHGRSSSRRRWRAGAQTRPRRMNATPADPRRSWRRRASVRRGRQRRGRRGGGALRHQQHRQPRPAADRVPVAIIAIGLLLALVLRSLVAPLYLIVSVALSYLAALGVATIVFIDLGGDGGISFILPFLMFIFLLALGEDYNILVMTRIREEARATAAARGGGPGRRADRADGHLGRDRPRPAPSPSSPSSAVAAGREPGPGDRLRAGRSGS